MSSRLDTERYADQQPRWPAAGRAILAQYTSDAVVVYQAFAPPIAEYACARQRFGGPFSLTRMSWIKPNFLWMMYRCGWATKENQERVLAVWLRRDAFEGILAGAVASTWQPRRFETPEAWRRALAASSVRLQWDPDHDPAGRPLRRRAVQFGLRGETLRRYAEEWVVRVEDVTPFVREQAAHAAAPDRLVTPRERVYTPQEAGAAAIGLGDPEDGTC